MPTLVLILCMLALVAGSGLATRLAPRVPLPLLQIAIGALAGWPAGGLHVVLDPQLFMLLFIPPMLFVDGWKMPKRELGAYKWPIALLSTVMVLFTVWALGHLIQWLLPAVPRAAAFLLAAVLSPTDAVAVSAILQRQRLPASLRHVIEGESLMNDAAALVAVKFGIAAVLTRGFSLPHLLGDLAWVAGGGIAVGVGFSVAFGWIYARTLACRDGRSAPASVLLLMLMPFAPYLIAEHLDLSGVMAAVSAGMAASVLAVRHSRFDALHQQTEQGWTIVLFAFRGLIFTLVGLQLPGLVRHPPEPLQALVAGGGGGGFPLGLLGIAAVLTAGLLAIRFFGLASALWIARRLRPAREARRHAMSLWTWSGLAALGGTRGGLTLAAVLGVPLALADGTAFPARDLLVFQAALVIVLSMCVAAVGLPWLLRRVALPGVDPQARETDRARLRITRAALRSLHDGPPSTPGDPAADGVRSRIGRDYGQRLAMVTGRRSLAGDPCETTLERTLRLAALQVERDELRRLRLAHRINDETVHALMQELDAVEWAIRRRF
jgi:CPA1 family monovalent cation:H+ antiporter